MIIVKVMGGLGNQLQQYAIYQKFLSMGTPAKPDVCWFEQKQQQKQLKPRSLELSLFDGLSLEACTREERERLIGRENSVKDKLLRRLAPERFRYFAEQGRMYLPEIFDLTDCYLEGYWACERYYADILPKLRQMIVFPASANPKNEEMAERMQSCASVSVHIRRGDYLDASNAALFGGICTEDYYEQAFCYVRERIPDARFFFFSDDPAYVRERYGRMAEAVIDWNTGRDSFYDMYLMSRCRHQICANSTFSFWGARLNPYAGKIMLRPLKHRNNQNCERERMEHLWQGWVLLDLAR